MGNPIQVEQEEEQSRERAVEDHERDGKLRKRSKDLDPWTAWAYKPHTVTFLMLGACFSIWASAALQPEKQRKDPISNVKGVFFAILLIVLSKEKFDADYFDLRLGDIIFVQRGIWATLAVLLGYFTLQAPPTILIRPHPAFWRLVHGIAVTYLLFLTFLLFQTRHDAQQFMKYLHPDLGVELGERAYGADCRIYTPENPDSKFANVKDTVFDEFVIAHILGWWGKSFMVRNLALSWMLSIGFEMMEVTFNHMLPNFNECWWDSLILDVAICNLFGIWAGLKTVQYFAGKRYDWVGLSRQPSMYSKLKRSLSQFTPATVDKDQWNFLSGPIRFVQVIGLVIVILIVELNAFFLKSVLWIPPTNPLNSYRLIIWWLIANPSIREWNSYIQSSKEVKKIGAFCWLAIAIVLLEVLIGVKFGQGYFPKPMPTWIFWFWVTAGVSFVLFLIGWSVKLYRDPKPDDASNAYLEDLKKTS